MVNLVHIIETIPRDVARCLCPLRRLQGWQSCPGAGGQLERTVATVATGSDQTKPMLH